MNTMTHNAVDDLCRSKGDAARIRILHESIDGRCSEVELFDPSASARANAALRTLPHYDDSELTLYAHIDDELRGLARGE